MAKDPRLSIPAFREAHKDVCKVYHGIDHSKFKRIPELRKAAQAGDKDAQDLLARYEAVMAKRLDSTKKGA